MAAVALALLALPFALAAAGTTWVRITNFAILFVLLSLGLNIVVGFAGLLDLGYIAFYAVGAYVYALLARRTSASIGRSGPSSDRRRGGRALRRPDRRPDAQDARRLSRDRDAGFRRDRADLPQQPVAAGQHHQRAAGDRAHRPDPARRDRSLEAGRFPRLAFSGPVKYYYFLLLVLLAVVFICLRLQNSRIGRAWEAIREDEVAARSMGIDTTRLKLLAFAMGATFGGVAGGMFSAIQGFVSPRASCWSSRSWWFPWWCSAEWAMSGA